MFSDLRGFTNLSEQTSPATLLSILNEYLTGMSLAIEAQGGVIDKYIGDAIMALFGAPISNENHANQCVAAALQMQAALKGINRDFEAKGWPTLSMGIGINTDTVVAGNMGSDNRMNYTVIGDGVNLASRVEGLCKHYGVDTIVTDTTAQQATQFQYRELDRVTVKGKQHSVVILEPYGVVSGDQEQQIRDYHTALDLYRQQQWDRADRAFADLHSRNGHRLYYLYLERICYFRQQPPQSDWDGVFVHDK